MKKSGNALENLLQAQKDPFGAHTYGGLDGPRADLSHQPDRARRKNRGNNVQWLKLN
jgi:6-phosphogluconate dehydrogenase